MPMNENVIQMFRGWLPITQTERPLEVWAPIREDIEGSR
jgi:hypothetical protein